jgi:type I restriction enzyme S subunit
MTEEWFFEKFELLADAPDAVTKMRRLVLELAFSGAFSGTGRSTELVSNGWVETRVDEIAVSITPGFACSRSHQVEGGHVHLRTHNISTQGRINSDLLVRIDSKMIDPRKASLSAGDVLFNNTNSQELVGKSCLVDRDYDYGFSNHITRIQLCSEAFPGYVVFYFTHLRNSGYFSGICTRWINQAAVNTDALKKLLVPIPPLAEQKRIVAKVDELMALCDQLEAQQQERETRKSVLVRASLARFAEAPTPANLGFLFHKSYDIPSADLRQSILTLAIQGKLVPQVSHDEPVSQLLERLVSLRPEPPGKVPKSLLPIDTDSLTFDLPLSWEWVQAQDLCRPSSLITYGVLKPVWVDVGVPTVRVQDMQDGNIIVDGVGQCSPERAAKFGKTTLEDGDLLIAKDGATLGKTAFVPRSLAGGNITQHVLRFPMTPHVDRVFIRLVIDSPHGQAWMRSETKGVALPGVNVGDFRRMPIPLPPLAEQRRIVAKVDELMALVDELQRQQETSRIAATKLLDAIVYECKRPQ